MRTPRPMRPLTDQSPEEIRAELVAMGASAEDADAAAAEQRRRLDGDR